MNSTISRLVSEIRNAAMNCAYKSKKMKDLKLILTPKVEEDRHYHRLAPGFYAKISSFRPELFRESFPNLFSLPGGATTTTNRTIGRVETDRERMFRESNEEYERLNRLW